MNPRTRRLIDRVKDGIRNPPREFDPGRPIDGVERGPRIFPPATKARVVAAERQLGFRLPELLRAVYTGVANGGFGLGPAYGFIGVQGGANPEGRTLVRQYQALRKLAKENRWCRWPEKLLPVCSLGCGMWSCFDCVEPANPVLLFDPNGLNGEGNDQTETILRWSGCFWHEARSFGGWLENCYRDGPWPEPTWPSRR
jgi:hypothetical protein